MALCSYESAGGVSTHGAAAGHRESIRAAGYGSWPSTTTVLASFRHPSVLGFPGRLLLQIWLATICVAGPLSMVCWQPDGNELHWVFPLPGGSMSLGWAMVIVAKARSGGEVLQFPACEQSITGSVNSWMP